MFDCDKDHQGTAQSWDPVEARWIDAPTLQREGQTTSRDTVPPGVILLRPWHEDDLDRYVALLDDPEVWQHLPEPYPDPLGRDLAAQLIALSNSADHHLVRAAVLNGLPVGQVRLSFTPGSDDHACAEIGYWLGRDYWGKRIARDMVARFSAQCFAMMPTLHQQYARVHRDNPASRRVLERIGFVDAGPCRDHAGFDILTRQRPA